MCQKSITIVVAATLAVAAAQSSSSLPIVDLGYEVHKASLEVSGSFQSSSSAANTYSQLAAPTTSQILDSQSLPWETSDFAHQSLLQARTEP